MIEVLTPWIGSGEWNNDPNGLHGNYPKLVDSFAWEPGDRVRDGTGQKAWPVKGGHPTPNIYVVRVWCSAQTEADIAADSEYFILPQGDDPINAQDWGQLRAYLSDSMDNSQINEAIGNNRGGRSKAEIVAELVAWLKDRVPA
jgi:hypothetical protein